MPESDPSASCQLIERASEGDRSAIEDLLVDELGRLRAFVRLNVDRIVRERESCSDLVQSTCREVLESLDRFEYRGRAAFRGWLYSVTLNKIRDRRRFYLAQKRHPAREVPPGSSCGGRGAAAIQATWPTPSEHALRQEEIELLETAFDELSPLHREVIGLSRIAGLSCAEIAKRLGREPGAVRVLLHRALARLSTVLERVDASGA